MMLVIGDHMQSGALQRVAKCHRGKVRKIKLDPCPELRLGELTAARGSIYAVEAYGIHDHNRLLAQTHIGIGE